MNDKLSELSKPVAWAFKDANDVEHASIIKKANLYGRHDFQPLYSQEYVSALLAENERVASDLVARNGEIEGLRKRAAELEAIATEYAGKFQKAQDANKHLIIMSNDDKKRIDELKAQVKVWESAATKHLERTEEAEQRIAELSELETHNVCLIKKNADLTQQNIKLGEQLATPVRLPDIEFVKISGIAFPVMRADIVKKEIRHAGFKVEGDA